RDRARPRRRDDLLPQPVPLAEQAAAAAGRRLELAYQGRGRFGGRGLTPAARRVAEGTRHPRPVLPQAGLPGLVRRLVQRLEQRRGLGASPLVALALGAADPPGQAGLLVGVG